MATELTFKVWTSHTVDSPAAQHIARNLTALVRKAGDTEVRVVGVVVSPVEPADILALEEQLAKGQISESGYPAEDVEDAPIADADLAPGDIDPDEPLWATLPSIG